MREHFLTLLRDKKTAPPAFRQAAKELASLMAHEIALSLPLKPHNTQTPMGETSGAYFDHPVVLIPILRSGLAFLPPFLGLFPHASIGFFGIGRNEENAQAELYYEKLPPITSDTYVFLLEPMLATGGTAHLALDRLAKSPASPAHTFLVTFLASKPGIEAVAHRHPQVHIHAAAIDPHLDAKQFIVPGLGDFGDRYFGT